MVLKLLLLSNKTIERQSLDNYKKFEKKIKKNTFKFSEEQEKALIEMDTQNSFRVHVLQGVTGSGKTIVYFESLKKIIAKGFQGLILLPEIGLTSQFEKKIF